MTFSRVDWLIFLFVPLVAWLLAVWAKSRVKMSGTYRGYFLAQGQLGVGSVGATYIGANLTFTSIFLILSQESFKRGWWVLAVPVFWIIGTLLFIKAYPKIRPHIIEGRTLHQTLGFAFQSKALQQWAAVWTIIAFVGTVALEFYGGILLVRWSGIPLVTAVTIVLSLAFVVSAFTISGGLRGVAMADVFLDVATLVSAVILIVNIWPFPFVDRLQNGLTTSTPSVSSEQIVFVASMAVLFIPFQFCTLDSWQRLLAWDKKGGSPKSWLLSAGALLAVAYCVPISIGVFVKLLGLRLGATGQPLEVALNWMHLSAGWLGLCIAGLAGAVLSTADELLNCTSLSLLADFWGIPFSMTRESKEAERLGASGKFYTALFALVAAAVALLALRFTRELSDMALAIFSAQVVFAWPLAAALLTPDRAPLLAKWAVRAMVVGGVSSILIVALAWILDIQDLAAGAPVMAFILAGLIFGLPWALVRKPRVQ
jgi:Na+/pantothenate symporter